MADSPLQPKKRQEKSRRPSSKKQAVAPSRTPRVSPEQVLSCDDVHILIAKRAYDLYCERGYRHGNALDDWLDAEREILSRIPPV
jgi:hypothetical protein